MVARALAQEPQLLLLDEPTAFLDLPRRVEIMHILRGLARDEGRTVLLSTHDLDLALRNADKVWLMDMDGSLCLGAPEDLVLSGAFARTFRGAGVTFDPYSGSFQVQGNEGGEVDLEGEGLPAVWTQRALERAGFRVNSGANGAPVRVIVVSNRENGTPGSRSHWQVTVAGRTETACSIKEMIDYLRRRSPEETS
jgi:iron complex transport system ATP-binding protein